MVVFNDDYSLALTYSLYRTGVTYELIKGSFVLVVQLHHANFSHDIYTGMIIPYQIHVVYNCNERAH